MAKSEAPTGADIKSKFKPLTEEAVQESTDGGSFSRGKSYYRSGHIFDAVVRGNTISARCEGSDVRPYTVRATLPTADQKDARAVISYECDCPRGGFCKHVVALLLTWIHKPETFEVRPEIAALLKDKSREELLALVLRMVEQNPELESLLDLPFPTAAHEPGAAGRPTILAGTIRKQTAAAFRRNGYEWGAASATASAKTTRGPDSGPMRWLSIPRSPKRSVRTMGRWTTKRAIWPRSRSDAAMDWRSA